MRNQLLTQKKCVYYFENTSQLKINYHKSEVMVLAVTREESAQIARLLNCRERALPMKYLDILVINMKL
jgi:hypothetical protein